MKNVFAYTLLFALLATAYASVSTGIFRDPAHPGKCVVDSKVYEPGVHTSHGGGCARITCSEGGFVEIADCGLQKAGPGCTMGKQLKPEADYPDCCELDIVCENN